MKQYKEDFRRIVSDKGFQICVILTVILAFAYSAFQTTVGIDDLEVERYARSGLVQLSAGRFTIPLLSVIANYGGHAVENAFTLDFLGVLGLIWTAVNLCILFRWICKEALTNTACTVFACVFVSYPLIMEIWEYTGANLTVGFGYLCTSVALLLMYRTIHGDRNWVLPVCSAVLMMLVCAAYESLVNVYIFVVFATLFLQILYGPEQEKKLKTILLQGIFYAAVLAAGLVLRLVVHKLILTIGHLDPTINGEASIYWLSRTPKEVILTILAGFYHDYLLRGIVYFPITELLISCAAMLVIGIVLAKKHGSILLLPLFGMYFSLIALSLMQGAATPYRACQVFAVLVAFVFLLFFLLLDQGKYPKIRLIALFLTGYLCFFQASYVNYFLTLNHMRSDHDAAIIQDIGDTLYEHYDVSKPIVFVGSGSLPDHIREAASIPETSIRWQLYKKLFLASEKLSAARFSPEMLERKLPDTNVNSVVDFGIISFEQESMQHLFCFYGYPYAQNGYRAYYDTAAQYVMEQQVPAYPQSGYIVDNGDYILVHIQ